MSPNGRYWFRLVPAGTTGSDRGMLRHRIEIRGRAHTAQDGANWVVSIWPQMTWVDRAAMHPGTTTELDSGRQVDDSSFTAAGRDYDERIMFELVGTILHPDASSKWRVSGGTATHFAAWPPDSSVTPPSGTRG